MSKIKDAVDIIINKGGKDYKEIEKVLCMETPELTFLLALYGLANNNYLEYWTRNSGDDTHSFSRTTYPQNSIEYDTYFGLITLLKRLGEPVDEVTKIAFESTSDNNVSFGKLENVRNYYGYLSGGVELLHYDIFKDGKDVSDIAISFSQILDRDNLYDTSRIGEF